MPDSLEWRAWLSESLSNASRHPRICSVTVTLAGVAYSRSEPSSSDLELLEPQGWCSYSILTMKFSGRVNTIAASVVRTSHS